MRYPGHIDKIRVLRESGFLSRGPVDVGGQSLRPLDLTAKLLFPLWKLADAEADLTAMRVCVEGSQNGCKVRRTFELLDRHDPATGTSSMARTTGYTCTAGVRLLARGMFTRPGIAPPELVGRERNCYAFVMGELAGRGVVFHETTVERG